MQAGILEFQAGATSHTCLQIIAEPAVTCCVGSRFGIANSGWERLTKIGESKKFQEQNYFLYTEMSRSLIHLFKVPICLVLVLIIWEPPN